MKINKAQGLVISLLQYHNVGGHKSSQNAKVLVFLAMGCYFSEGQ